MLTFPCGLDTQASCQHRECHLPGLFCLLGKAKGKSPTFRASLLTHSPNALAQSCSAAARQSPGAKSRSLGTQNCHHCHLCDHSSSTQGREWLSLNTMVWRKSSVKSTLHTETVSGVLAL